MTYPMKCGVGFSNGAENSRVELLVKQKTKDIWGGTFVLTYPAIILQRVFFNGLTPNPEAVLEM